ncbi:MAG: hypothetical protein MHM6MM_000496 [Cercozoa sp. M6MM]
MQLMRCFGAYGRRCASSLAADGGVVHRQRLQSFLKRVHPDLLRASATVAVHQTNSNSLTKLNSLLDFAERAQQEDLRRLGAVPAQTRLSFYVRTDDGKFEKEEVDVLFPNAQTRQVDRPGVRRTANLVIAQLSRLAGGSEDSCPASTPTTCRGDDDLTDSGDTMEDARSSLASEFGLSGPAAPPRAAAQQQQPKWTRETAVHVDDEGLTTRAPRRKRKQVKRKADTPTWHETNDITANETEESYFRRLLEQDFERRDEMQRRMQFPTQFEDQGDTSDAPVDIASWFRRRQAAGLHGFDELLSDEQRRSALRALINAAQDTGLASLPSLRLWQDVRIVFSLGEWDVRHRAGETENYFDVPPLGSSDLLTDQSESVDVHERLWHEMSQRELVVPYDFNASELSQFLQRFLNTAVMRFHSRRDAYLAVLGDQFDMDYSLASPNSNSVVTMGSLRDDRSEQELDRLQQRRRRPQRQRRR